jgi:hypothetical protein
MHFRLLFVCIAASLYGAEVGSTYAITTTIFLSEFQNTTATHQPKSSLIATEIPPPYSTTAKATAKAFFNNTSTASNSSNATLPSPPLSSDQSDALTSFLNLITSIPDNILSAGENGVKDFFTNISSCVTGDSKALEDTVASQLPKLASLAHEVGGEITSAAGAGASIVTSLAGAGESAVKSEASEVTSVAASLVTQATSEIAGKISEAVPVATSLLGDAGGFLSGLGQNINLKERADALDILDEVGTVTACIANAVTTNPLFKVGECAKDLATLVVPAAELLRLKQLTGAAGGVVKVVQALTTSKSLGDVLKNGGAAVVDVLQGVSGIGDTVKDCQFLAGKN